MIASPSLATLLIALGLTAGLPAAALAASGHAGHAPAAAALELRLDNGARWRTDDALRTGVSRIRAELDAVLPAIHSNRFTAGEYVRLGDRVDAEIEYVAANCKPPEDGAKALVEALKAYGEHFDHPGWAPMAD